LPRSAWIGNATPARGERQAAGPNVSARMGAKHTGWRIGLGSRGSD